MKHAPLLEKLPEGPLQLDSDPLKAFGTWLQAAEDYGCLEPISMTLASVDKNGQPSARVVLFRGFSDGGFRFFTNYESRKGRELIEQPRAALCFHWAPMQRQVRIEGVVEKLSAEESNEYFQGRPRGSRIGAWSSPQSQPIQTRAELLQRIATTEEKFKDQEIPCPEFWGGFRVRPNRIEFWEAREFRVHERLVYLRDLKAASTSGPWTTQRLAP